MRGGGVFQFKVTASKHSLTEFSYRQVKPSSNRRKKPSWEVMGLRTKHDTQNVRIRTIQSEPSRVVCSNIHNKNMLSQFAPH